MTRDLAIVSIVAASLLFFVVTAMGQGLFPNCRGFIGQECCCTNSCCYEIDAEEVTQVGPGRYRIEASGQEIDARPSQDGKRYRCACDLIEGVWTVHPTAYTRCLYVFNGV
jgi:hypothetical protein